MKFTLLMQNGCENWILAPPFSLNSTYIFISPQAMESCAKDTKLCMIYSCGSCNFSMRSETKRLT